MRKSDIKTCWDEVLAARRLFHATCLSAFRRLKHLDTELYIKAVHTLENEDEAAHWFSDRLEAYEGQTAWEVLLSGKRQVILAVLARMEHGIYA